jgi:hypothetical protein
MAGGKRTPVRAGDCCGRTIVFHASSFYAVSDWLIEQLVIRDP